MSSGISNKSGGGAGGGASVPKVTHAVQSQDKASRNDSKSMNVRPFVADSSKLAPFGARRSQEGPTDEIEVFRLHSLTARSYHTSIIDSAELAALATELTLMYNANLDVTASPSSSESATTAAIRPVVESSPVAQSDNKGIDDECVYVNGLKLKVPPMIFDKDILSFTFKGVAGNEDVVISFRGRDALFAWVKRHAQMEISEDGSRSVVLPHNEFVKVPFAEQWNAARVKKESDQTSNDISLQTYNDIKVGAGNKWDWTYTSDYCCSYAFTSGPQVGAECRSFIATASNLAISSTLTGSSSDISSDSSGSNSAGAREERSWRPVASSGINMALLRDQSQPILFSDEFMLYQDDLEDSGDVSVSVRVRVMPTCVFILYRFFLRVDGSIIRMRETRIFHEFSLAKPAIHMETLWKEVSLLPIGEGVPTTVFDTQTAALRAKLGSDFNLQSDQNMLSQQLPVVNSKYNIHPYYTMDL